MTFGILAKQYCFVDLPLQVLESAAGFYIGTADQQSPVSRESIEYWSKKEAAELALRCGLWSQRTQP